MKKVSLQYKSSYFKDGKRNFVYAVVGNADAVAAYKLDKENSDLGRCPMMSDADGNDTDVPRYTTQQLLGANGTLERSAKGNWFTPADELSLLTDAIASTTDADIKHELAMGAADIIRAKIRAQVKASGGNVSATAGETPATGAGTTALADVDADQHEN